MLHVHTEPVFPLVSSAAKSKHWSGFERLRLDREAAVDFLYVLVMSPGLMATPYVFMLFADCAVFGEDAHFLFCLWQKLTLYVLCLPSSLLCLMFRSKPSLHLILVDLSRAITNDPLNK